VDVKEMIDALAAGDWVGAWAKRDAARSVDARGATTEGTRHDSSEDGTRDGSSTRAEPGRS